MPDQNAIERYVIYPGIGIARVGNSPEEYFIGPEAVFDLFNRDPKFGKPRRPSFWRDIFPIFERLVDNQWVNSGVSFLFGSGSPSDLTDPDLLYKLSSPAEEHKPLRTSYFNWFRDPADAAGPQEPEKLPPFYGDAFGDYNDLGMDDLPVTPTQYEWLRNWADGDFDSDPSRFLEPLSGKIYLDGKPVTSLPLSHLRRQIAFVSQDVFLFSDSITSNIRMGNSSVSDEDIYEAARMANALKFINAMPDKFDTQVGERGARLSGGQRQRIAIARALVRDAPILVLDEATSAVDPETEAAVHEALCSLMKNRTTIIIAHHSTAFIEYVNRAFVLEMGELRPVPVSTFMLDSRRAVAGFQV